MRLRNTLPALTDLASILDYVAEPSPQGAKRIRARIRPLTDLLLPYPLAGIATDDPTIRRMTTTLRGQPSTRSLFTPCVTEPWDFLWWACSFINARSFGQCLHCLFLAPSVIR